ncbi:MAG: hypothetical protein V7L01_09265 [Nostoc sp.]
MYLTRADNRYITAVEQLYVEVALLPKEGIIWEIEPLPENYDRELLKF